MKKKSKPEMKRVRGRVVRTDEIVELERTQPSQLTLFQTFVPDDPRAGEYSNTIELWDAVPKYFSSSTRMAKSRKAGAYLPVLRHDFEHHQQWYTVEITPARIIDRHGSELEYYPTQREEILEEVLKKIAIEKGKGVYLDGQAGVQFKLYDLYKELKERGHTLNYPQIIQSLRISHGVGITVRPRGASKVLLSSHFLPLLILADRDDPQAKDRNLNCYVMFNPLVTRSISRLTYRQFHYITFMSLKNQLARYLFKRLSHNYTQAAWDEPYSILMSTIVRDSALVNHARQRDQVRYIDKALDELAGTGKGNQLQILMTFDKNIRRGQWNKIEDILYTLTPSLEFIAQMKKANMRDGFIKPNNWQTSLLNDPTDTELNPIEQ